MSSPIDTAFGNVSKIPYTLTINGQYGNFKVAGELTLQSIPTSGPKGLVQIERVIHAYVDDAEMDVYPPVGAGMATERKVGLILRRTIPHYYIALLNEDGKPWLEWSADSNPYDDISPGGKVSTLFGLVDGGYGAAVLLLTLTFWPFSTKSGPAVENR